MIRYIDGLGRIVIPADIRQELLFSSNQPIEFSTDGNKVIMKKYSCCKTIQNCIRELICMMPGCYYELCKEDMKQIEKHLKQIERVLINSEKKR